MKTQVFGNTLHSLRGATLLALMLALAVSVPVYFLAPLAGSSVERAIDSALLGVVVLLIVAVGILPTCLFSLRVDDTHISHILVGKIVLSSMPLVELHPLRSGGASGQC